MTPLEAAARAIFAETGPVEVSARAVYPVRAEALAELARALEACRSVAELVDHPGALEGADVGPATHAPGSVAGQSSSASGLRNRDRSLLRRFSSPAFSIPPT